MTMRKGTSLLKMMSRATSRGHAVPRKTALPLLPPRHHLQETSAGVKRRKRRSLLLKSLQAMGLPPQMRQERQRNPPKALLTRPSYKEEAG
jgi:hypothetical protein